MNFVNRIIDRMVDRLVVKGEVGMDKAVRRIDIIVAVLEGALQGAKMQQDLIHKLRPHSERLNRKFYKCAFNGDALGLLAWMKETAEAADQPGKEVVIALADDLTKRYHIRNEPIDTSVFN